MQLRVRLLGVGPEDRQAPLVAAAAALNGLQFPFIGMDILGDGLHQKPGLIGLTLGPENAVLGLAQLILDRRQLEFHLGGGPGGLGQLGLPLLELLLELLLLLRQSLQFVGS